MQISSNPEEVEKITNWLTKALFRSGLSDINQYQFRYAVVEAVNNCIQHAYNFRREQIIVLSCNIDKAEIITVTIKDKGKVIHPDLSQHSSDLMAEHGRGLNIITSWTSKVSYERNGIWNITRLHKNIL
jgi:anti-sigma regulatory factor (Ser/Thr protein kinase)